MVTALTLRNPEGCEAANSAGVFEAIAEAMSEQPDSAGVQRQACMAIRNMVVRNLELRPVAQGKGLEALIRKARARHPKQCDDVGSAALRDMGLDDYK